MLTAALACGVARHRRHRRDPDEWAQRCRGLGVIAVAHGDAEYPEVLVNDPQPPAVLFVRGDWSSLDARRVGIVGTRNATGPGS